MFLLEQFGGATGEPTAALQYWVLSFPVENAGIRDMLQDIALEEFSHLEMVGKLIAMHTSKIDQTPVHDAPLFRLEDAGPHFLDSQGACWTVAYISTDRGRTDRTSPRSRGVVELSNPDGPGVNGK